MWGVFALSLLMAWTLRREALFSLGSDAASDLGEFRLVERAELVSFQNRVVTGTGLLGASGGLVYERPLTSGSYRLMPVAGRDDIWVEMHSEGGREQKRWQPPSELAGRLVRFEEAGPRYRGLRAAIAARTGRTVPNDAWLLVHGASPRGARGALLLCGMFLLFAVYNASAALWLSRRLPRG